MIRIHQLVLAVVVSVLTIQTAADLPWESDLGLTTTEDDNTANSTSPTSVRPTTTRRNLPTNTETMPPTNASLTSPASVQPTSTNNNLSTNTQTTQTMPTNSPPDPVYCDRQYSCLNCTTARVCAPTANGTRLYEIDRVTCPPSAPTCDFDTGTCTTDAFPGCPLPLEETDNICMRDGIFPDPNNCSRYFECLEGFPITFDCPPDNPYYMFQYGKCSTYSSYCINGSNQCQGQSGLKVSSGLSSIYGNSYFLYCDNNTAVAVDRCIGSNQFYQYYQRCVPNCPFSGLYPSQGDCSEYYKCTSISQVYNGLEGYTLTNMTCPAGQGFSQTEFQCVDRSLVPNCNVTNSDFFNKR